MNLIDLAPLSIPLVFVAGILFVFVVDLALPKLGRGLGYITAALMLTTLTASFYLPSAGESLFKSYQGGEWSLFFMRVFLVAGILVVLGGIQFVAKRYPYRQGEYYLLLMASLLGMLLLPGAKELILLFVCFELMGLPLYILAAFAKTDALPKPDSNPHDKSMANDNSWQSKKNPAPQAALKLYLIGAVSTVVTLMGMSFIYGVAQTTVIAHFAVAPLQPILFLGIALVIAGFGYKIGAAPFHGWVADTYQGAGLPFVAFLSVAPKLAGLSALVALFVGGFYERSVLWLPVIVALAAFTLVVGNLLALGQNNIKRLLAFSGVGQMGYMLMALACNNEEGLAAMLFYGAGYVVTNIGVFLVVLAVTQESTQESLSLFDGLGRRSPWLALSMLLFLLSLAGIPFVVGFWAKLYVFLVAWQAGLQWLVVAGAAMAVVALFYYMQVAKALYMKDALSEFSPTVHVSLRLAIALCLALVVGMGAYPEPFLQAAQAAARAF